MRSRKYPMNYNQTIPTSTRFSDINGWLANLSGVWKVTDLLSAIRQISNSPDIKEIKQIGKIHVYADQSNLIDIDCLYIDFDCQRIFHLRKAVKKVSALSEVGLPNRDTSVVSESTNTRCSTGPQLKTPAMAPSVVDTAGTTVVRSISLTLTPGLT